MVITRTVKGDICDSGLAILHQTNCLTCRPYGLAKTLAERFPLNGDLYGWRTLQERNLAVPESRAIPGTVVRCAEGVGEPVIYHLMGQWAPGKPGSDSVVNTYPHYSGLGRPETAADRERWFWQGLESLDGACRGQGAPLSLAVPYNIGCGLAGGDWAAYRRMLSEVPHVHFEVWEWVPPQQRSRQ